jgi:tetratricopeptide (TPR) repeat protein
LRQQGRWAEARTVLEQTRDRLGESELADLRQRLEKAAADLDLVGRLETIRLRRATTALGTRFDDRTADHDYAAAFREQDLAQEGEAAQTVAARVRASAVRDHLVAALDDWAVVTEDSARRAWLLEIARRADPDRWRDRFRDPRVWLDRAALEGLAGELLRDEALLARQIPRVLAALGTALLATRANAVPLLEAAQARHPDDFWLNSLLGKAWYEAKQYGAAAGYYRAALAARPSSIAAHTNLGVALYEMRQLDEAIREFRAALELDPRFALGHNNLGIALRARGHLDEAIREFRTAIELDPTGVWAHYNLGVALDDNVQFDEAMRELGTVWRLKNLRTRYQLDIAPADAHKLEEFIRTGQYNLNPKSVAAASHYQVGLIRYAQGQVDQAIAEYRRAIQVAPKAASPHVALGDILLAKGQPDDAIGEFRTAITINPKYAWAHYDLGNALRVKGQPEEAAEASRRCLSLLPGEDYDPPPGRRERLNQLARQQLQELEELLAVAHELPAVLGGKQQPSDDAKRLALARLCHEPFQKRYLASCRFYEEAFAHDARLAGDLEKQPRYHAACVAALAGCGRGQDADRLDDKERGRWRQQARDWLRADLAAWAQALDTGKAPARAAVQQALRHWQTDADLGGVRDPDALAQLPEAERREWQRLWADLDALLTRAAAAK